MDFVRIHFFPNAPLTSWTIFSSLFGTCSTRGTPKWWKKCSTGQGYIRKDVISYKIHTYFRECWILNRHTESWFHHIFWNFETLICFFRPKQSHASIGRILFLIFSGLASWFVKIPSKLINQVWSDPISRIILGLRCLLKNCVVRWIDNLTRTFLFKSNLFFALCS